MMTKSFRNLVLSLFLAAGLAACIGGEDGPAGPAGTAGPTGTAGAQGETGEAGASADDVPRSYAYLRTWGKPDGMAACSDPVLRSKDPFPGPATLTKISAAPAATVRNLLASGDLGTPGTTGHEGRCSNAVYAAPALDFKLTHGTTADDVTETPKRGTTAVLGNETLTEVKKEFREGDVRVTFNQNASELSERDLVPLRCAVGTSSSADKFTGRYRVVKITETESILVRNQGTRAVKTGSEVVKTTIQVCVRFSAPGTVKCYVNVSAERRDPSDDTKATGTDDTEQIALYKNGQMTQVPPAPDEMNMVPGKNPPAQNARLFNAAATGGTSFVTLPTPAKLCNFFDGGVLGKSGATVLTPAQACAAEGGTWRTTSGTPPPPTCDCGSGKVWNSQTNKCVVPSN